MKTMVQGLGGTILAIVSLVAALLTPWKACAETTIGNVYDFADAGSIDDWNDPLVYAAAPGEEAGISWNAGRMDITVDITGNLGDPDFQRVWIDSALLLESAGYDGYLVGFDFYAGTTPPASMQIQFGNTNDTDIWTYDLGTIVSGFNRLTASFGDIDNWQLPFGSDYLDDLEAIDWISIVIYPADSNPYTYQVDNFSLMVPEPHECALLAGALVAAFMAVRRERLVRQTAA